MSEIDDGTIFLKGIINENATLTGPSEGDFSSACTSCCNDIGSIPDSAWLIAVSSPYGAYNTKEAACGACGPGNVQKYSIVGGGDSKYVCANVPVGDVLVYLQDYIDPTSGCKLETAALVSPGATATIYALSPTGEPPPDDFTDCLSFIGATPALVADAEEACPAVDCPTDCSGCTSGDPNLYTSTDINVRVGPGTPLYEIFANSSGGCAWGGSVVGGGIECATQMWTVTFWGSDFSWGATWTKVNMSNCPAGTYQYSGAILGTPPTTGDINIVEYTP